MALIEDTFVPLYLHHRYAVDSAVSVLGGQDYIYAMRGDGRTPVRWVPAEAQKQGARRADEHAQAERTDAVVEPARQDSAAPAGLRPDARAVSAHDRRRLRSDYPAVVATEMVVSGMLTNDRAARLVAQHA